MDQVAIVQVQDGRLELPSPLSNEKGYKRSIYEANKGMEQHDTQIWLAIIDGASRQLIEQLQTRKEIKENVQDTCGYDKTNRVPFLVTVDTARDDAGASLVLMLRRPDESAMFRHPTARQKLAQATAAAPRLQGHLQNGAKGDLTVRFRLHEEPWNDMPYDAYTLKPNDALHYRAAGVILHRIVQRQGGSRSIQILMGRTWREEASRTRTWNKTRADKLTGRTFTDIVGKGKRDVEDNGDYVHTAIWRLCEKMGCPWSSSVTDTLVKTVTERLQTCARVAGEGLLQPSGLGLHIGSVTPRTSLAQSGPPSTITSRRSSLASVPSEPAVAGSSGWSAAGSSVAADNPHAVPTASSHAGNSNTPGSGHSVASIAWHPVPWGSSICDPDDGRSVASVGDHHEDGSAVRSRMQSIVWPEHGSAVGSSDTHSTFSSVDTFVSWTPSAAITEDKSVPVGTFVPACKRPGAPPQKDKQATRIVSLWVPEHVLASVLEEASDSDKLPGYAEDIVEAHNRRVRALLHSVDQDDLGDRLDSQHESDVRSDELGKDIAKALYRARQAEAREAGESGPGADRATRPEDEDMFQELFWVDLTELTASVQLAVDTALRIEQLNSSTSPRSGMGRQEPRYDLLRSAEGLVRPPVAPWLWTCIMQVAKRAHT